MKLFPLPAFQDNYLCLLHDGQRALVGDPGDAQPVMACLQSEGLQLESILVTHHHPDHIGGVDFANAVEPDNAELGDDAARCQALRAQELPTRPSSIGLEKRINPFLRRRGEGVARAARAHGVAGTDAVSVFATLRQWKNEFE